MIDIKDGKLRISVRNLVEFICKSGDIDNRFAGVTEKSAMEAGSKAHKKIQKSIYNPKFDTSVTYNNGRKYVKEYVNGYGKDITVGYLQDLGYNKQVSEEFAKRIINSNRKTIF